jgi:hypothetical protein
MRGGKGWGSRIAFVLGPLTWALFVAIVRPDPFQVEWSHALLVLAPLVLVPVALPLAGFRMPWLGLATLPFAAAYLSPQGPVAVALALPWLVVTLGLALRGLALAWQRRRGPLADLCLAAGLVYLPVGAGWAALDRAGLRPLDFEPVIVLLTALHFHYAGFLLPLFTALLAREAPSRTARGAAVGVVAAVPLTALGITATQLGCGPALETAAAVFMASSAALVGGLHLGLSLRPAEPPAARALWALTGLTLLATMVLAGAYGLRNVLAVAWLDIPWMRTLHGTANALGFGLAGCLGWAAARGAEAPMN